jgi:hypothetical protein
MSFIRHNRVRRIAILEHWRRLMILRASVTVRRGAGVPDKLDEDEAYYKAKAAQWRARAADAKTERAREAALLVARSYDGLAQAVSQKGVLTSLIQTLLDAG